MSYIDQDTSRDDDFSDHERDWDALIDAYDSGLYDPQ